ncbi:MAG: S8 family serine peptidase, partial [Chloroflexi bacterium]|nr:S8 family serine peptidase [Chloroflexota bacterium]
MLQRIFLIPILLAVALASQSSSWLSTSSHYVEPALLTAANSAAPLQSHTFAAPENFSVIVTAADAATAARAVEQVGGQVTSQLWLIDAVGARVSAEQFKQLAADPALVSLVGNQSVEGAAVVPLEGATDGKDVQPTADPFVWHVLSPATMDVGADLVHKGIEGPPMTGQGVTVAVIDSGVYHDPVAPANHPEGMLNFIGQADFAGAGHCAGSGQQFDTYCWTDNQLLSADGYGHGTHVATTIGNRLIDADRADRLGVAPDARLLSIRVLDAEGVGTYEDVVEGIQYAVEKKDELGIRVINLSLTAYAVTPYFVDPVNRAAEAAWMNGIVVLAAAGNNGPKAQTITVPGNDPYVIAVGALDSNRTPGHAQWGDDFVPRWSAAGPSLDGFIKPDILAPGANVVAFMYNDPADKTKSAMLVANHPDYNAAISLYRLSGTSMATAVASGVVALMLQAQPQLTPDEVKFRLMNSAQSNVNDTGDLIYALLQQGSGRIWAPDAVWGATNPGEKANEGMDLPADLDHPWKISNEVDAIDTFDRDYDGVPNDRPVVANGLKYEYYEGVWNSVPAFDQLVAAKTGNVDNFSLAPRLHEGNFAMHLTGCIFIPLDGLYTFYLNSAGGSKLSIRGNEVVDNDGLHGPQERSGVVALPPGHYPIEVSYFEKDASALLDVTFDGPGFDRRVIPVEFLFQSGCARTSGATELNPNDGASQQNQLPLTPCTSKTILFVSNLTNDDQVIAARLRVRGFTLVVRNPQTATADDALNVDLVLISDAVDPATVNTKFRAAKTPVLTWNSELFDDMQMTQVASGVPDHGRVDNQTLLDLINAEHPLAGELKSPAEVNSAPVSFVWGTPAAGAVKIATILNHPEQVALFGYEAGAAMFDMNAPARRIGFPNGGASSFSQDGWNLFEASVTWGADCSFTGDLDDDNDGIPDRIELATALNNYDTDGDRLADNLDIDSDNDGNFDLWESGIPTATLEILDKNHDGIIDAGNHFGPNGLADALETTPESGIINYNIKQ